MRALRISLLMVSILAVITFVLSLSAYPQSPAAENLKQSLAPPALTTADRIAIQDCEKKKADAQKEWTDANQQELSVIREWEIAHSGWQINPSTFLIEKKADKPAEKK